MYKFLALLSLFFIVSGIEANNTFVDQRDVNIIGIVKEISAPNILKIETLRDGQRQYFWVELAQVDFGEDRDTKCRKEPNQSHHKRLERDVNRLVFNKNDDNACLRMHDWLDEKTVSIEVTEWSQPILKGFVFLGSKNINYDLITKGWYPVDYRQTRDASLALLEKEARCERVGIWQSKKGNPVEDLKCQH